jgi:hypothetical protein
LGSAAPDSNEAKFNLNSFFARIHVVLSISGEDTGVGSVSAPGDSQWREAASEGSAEILAATKERKA